MKLVLPSIVVFTFALTACGSHAPGSFPSDGGGDQQEADTGDAELYEDVAPEVASDAVDAEAGPDADAAFDVVDAPAEEVERDAPPAERAPNQWLTLGGDVLRSGFNRGETGHPPLARDWQVVIDASGAALWPAVSDGATVYVTGMFAQDASTVHVAAFTAAKGKASWTQAFENIPAAARGPSFLTLAGDHLFLGCCYGQAFLYALFAETGKVHWSQPLGDFPYEIYWAPLATNGAVYGPGLCGLGQSDGAPRSCVVDVPGSAYGLSLALSDAIYTQGGTTLWATSAQNGAPLHTAMYDGYFDAFTKPGVPASDGRNVYVVSPPKLRAFGPDLSRPLWGAVGGFEDGPAVADGVVLGIGGGKLKAIDAESGDPLWTFTGATAINHPPVIAAGWAYVASKDDVYAVNLATGVMAWHDQPGGWLSIAGGHLFVGQSDGILRAYSLTP